VQEVSDAFLLNVAEVSATLIGLFIVGVLFYVETGFRRLGSARATFEPYFRSGTRIVLVLYAMPLILSLTLVVLSLGWNRVLFLLLSAILVAANVDSARRARGIVRSSGSSNLLLLNEALGTLAVTVLVVLPWILGGFSPTREDLTWAILISFGAGFLSISAVVMSVFDMATYDAPAEPEPEEG
jgi:heme/copper-type cytochrome/quinol oxidase subunit 2